MRRFTRAERRAYGRTMQLVVKPFDAPTVLDPDTGLDPYCVARSITGEPTTGNRQVRVTRAGAGARAGRGTWADVTVRDAHTPPELLRQLGTVGTGFTDDGTPMLTVQGGGTVRVTRADGTVAFTPVSSYSRKRREARRSRRHAGIAVVPETARIATSARDARAIAEGIA